MLKLATGYKDMFSAGKTLKFLRFETKQACKIGSIKDGSVI